MGIPVIIWGSPFGNTKISHMGTSRSWKEFVTIWGVRGIFRTPLFHPARRESDPPARRQWWLSSGCRQHQGAIRIVLYLGKIDGSDSQGEGLWKILYQAYHMLKKVKYAQMKTCQHFSFSNLSSFPAGKKYWQTSRQTVDRFANAGTPYCDDTMCDYLLESIVLHLKV